MKTSQLLLLAACAAPAALEAAEQLEIRTGDWEITSHTRISGSPPWTQELRDKLTPEQRAEIEAAFARNADKTPKTEVTRECITAQDIERPFHTTRTEGCTQHIVRTTRTMQEAELVCTGEYKGSGTLKITAPDPQSMAAELDLRAGEGEHVMRVHSRMEGRWLSEECEEEPDADEDRPPDEDTTPPEEYDEPEDQGSR